MLKHELEKELKRAGHDKEDPAVKLLLSFLEKKDQEQEYSKFREKFKVYPEKLKKAIASGENELDAIEKMEKEIQSLKHDYLGIFDGDKTSFAEEILQIIKEAFDAKVQNKLILGDELEFFYTGSGGVQPGVHIIGGKPGAGKSTMLLNITTSLWKHNRGNMPRVIFYSLDDNKKAIIKKILSKLSRVNQNTIFDDEQEFTKNCGKQLGYLMSRANDDVITVKTLPQVPTVKALKNDMAMEYKKAKGKTIFIVDSPRNLDTDKNFGADQNAKAEHIAMNFKQIFLTFDVPIIMSFEVVKAAFEKDFLTQGDLFGASKWAFVADSVSMLFQRDEKKFNNGEDKTICANLDKSKFTDDKGVRFLIFENNKANFIKEDYI